MRFELSTGEIYHVDIEEKGEAVPKLKRANAEQSAYLRNRLARLAPEDKIEACTIEMCGLLNRNDRYATSEISAYVRRIVSGMTQDELDAMETAYPVYAQKIEQKIRSLEEAYREEKFRLWLDSGRISCQELYAFPQVITPADTIDSIPKSLYEAEKNDMNDEERDLLDAVVALDNVKWWHRIIERNDFCINGYFKHYPDYIVMTQSGKIVLVEYKGDNLDNSNSARKVKLGRNWQAKANACGSGDKYRYFMVFKNRDFGIEGAVNMEQFMQIMREL